MIGAWTMNISGRVYGPYSADRMRTFIAEGRLAPHSLVTREGASDWHEARHEPEFTDLFPHGAAAAQGGSANASANPFGEVSEHTRAQFAIIVDLKSRSTGNLEKAIMGLGPAHRLMPTVWILSTDQTVSAVRNRLVQELGKLDTLFVVDATRGKAAWFNFGPEADVRIRRVWHKPV